MKTIKHYLTTSTCCLLVFGLISCGNNSKNETVESRTIPVKVLIVNNTDNVYQQEYIGTVESDNAVDLSFQVNGNIEQIYVKEGQNVQKGQLLARLNTSTLESSYSSAKATLTQAQDSYDRLTRLYNSNSLPEIKHVEVKTALEQAQANERIAKKNLNDCNLNAPFSGVIGQRHQEAGANVMPGTPVINLMSIGTVKVKVAIPENNISSVHVGDACQIKISALGNKTLEGKVLEKGVVAHPISHTYDIKIQLDNQDKEIMPGMVSKAYLINKDRKGGIIIPLKSVQIDASGKHFVWLVDGSNKALYKEIKIGELIGNGILIEEGLNDGDSLITDGYQNLSPRISVQVI